MSIIAAHEAIFKTPSTLQQAIPRPKWAVPRIVHVPTLTQAVPKRHEFLTKIGRCRPIKGHESSRCPQRKQGEQVPE